ncbi:hypothetical protein KUCAC02_013250 [Chaenocephalus aceratus]|nr:hypothetical protein KUCAC02_013250 [Chaenocephalus aceratus]
MKVEAHVPQQRNVVIVSLEVKSNSELGLNLLFQIRKDPKDRWMDLLTPSFAKHSQPPVCFSFPTIFLPSSLVLRSRSTSLISFVPFSAQSPSFRLGMYD